MNEALKVLQERGFFQQCTNLEGLSERMDKGPISFYVGIDPTGPSLHIGHMLPVFAARHLCAFGHKACILAGGGTARIGDPSGKTEMRKMLSYETLDKNVESIIAQLGRFLDFDGKTIFHANNKDWLANLNYIDFLREIGSQFSVNRMLSFESYKRRMETGLSFIEFNYQLLQSYDFLMLNEKHNIEMQIGGDDQWGNIVAGVDLIRRLRSKEVFGLTFALVTRADGQKMGKSEKGALFLDPELVSPYEFFQYWRNTMDADVRKFMLLFTFLPIEEIDSYIAENINKAKEKLAYEVTRLIHGKEAADSALEGARAAFGAGGDKSSMPTIEMPYTVFEKGIDIVALFVEAQLASSKSEARRLIEQGGAFVGEATIKDIKAMINTENLNSEKELILRAGKKRFVRIIVR
ncbi:tyrosine--tRNA ligase [Treponema phagedenis]|uniref:Tyrosine--tRNA ligase n=1 Tax=Treponema phagedenis TaxID=162 RepID=A0A0B7H1I0_TREPH|nr:tyrosine--tRNA ligase [Treponema phagedenis]NVP24464.1 tyrosine--tRNA ligase [Treponema phagedenis]QEJ95483.1 tyrosine--tRNA ligase [Treponema phagedenis]QEJ97776.1 tyrosine--tRNA ligase [Treponema phagedenis]QEK01336.1 tyrosine--tRNA ligase [Treponema phagedenis]QEK03342.1 tyrosine--tRNA ligase [Treponema phagedenis]